MKFYFFALFLAILFLVATCKDKSGDSQSNQNEFDKPIKCKNNEDCRKAGHANFYCRDTKIFFSALRHHSECAPKRGYI